MKLTLIFLISAVMFSFVNVVYSKDDGKTWAIILVGEDWYRISYGMEGGAYKRYNELLDQGIPKERIITISPDSIAFSSKNPNPGVVTYAKDAGLVESMPNYYEEVEVDYRDDITPDDFYEILKGNKTERLLEIGTGKVLASGPKDNVYFHYVGFGVWGYFGICSWYLTNLYRFIQTLENLKQKKHFNKMFLSFDSGHPGRIFDDYLDRDQSILAYTLGGRYDYQYLCHYNKALGAFTSTCAGFSQHTHTEKSLGATNGKEIIHDYFQNSVYLGADTPIAHNLYGQLEMAQDPIGNFLGFGTNKKEKVLKNYSKQVIDTDMKSLRKYVKEQTASRITLEDAVEQDDTIPQKEKDRLEKVMSSIVRDSLQKTGISLAEIDNTNYKFDFKINENYENVLNKLKRTCFTKENKILFILHMEKLAKLMYLSVSSDAILAAVKKNC